jgi:TRAP-type transport system periplasmic protein
MNRRFFAMIGALAVLMTAGGAQSQTRELVYGSWVSPKHGVMRYALPYLFKGVAKDTNNAVTWKLVAGGQLVNGRGTLAGLRDGLIDGGLGIPSYTPKNLPATNSIFSTLVFGEDQIAATGATTETVLLDCPQCQKEFKKNKVVFLGGYSASPFMLMCRDRVTTLAELKGKKVRSSGGGVLLMKMAGAVPVAMSPAAATTALQRGALDCVLGAPAWLRSYGYQDIVRSIVQYPLGMVGPVLTVYFSRKTWDKMTTAQKKANLKYTPRVMAESTITAYMAEDDKILNNAKAKGVTLYKAGKEFDDLVARRTKMQRDQNIARATKLGVKNAAAIADAFERNLAKWRRLSGDIGRDPAKFAAVLQREIFDKVDVDKL